MARDTYFKTFLRAVEREPNTQGILGDDRVVFPPSPDFGYGSTPRNAITFGDMGCDGVHYAILALDGVVTDESPVIHVSPMDFSEPYAVLGATFFDYLAHACAASSAELDDVFARERRSGGSLVPFLRARFSHERLYDEARFQALAPHLRAIDPKPED